jgi:hypothetical protein
MKQFSPVLIFHFSVINFHPVSMYDVRSTEMASLRKRSNLMNTWSKQKLQRLRRLKCGSNYITSKRKIISEVWPSYSSGAQTHGEI